MLAVDSIVKHFHGSLALDRVSIEVRAGHSVGLVGPNGSGKSTLLNVITGFERPDGGTVKVAGLDVTGKQPWTVAAHGLRRTFQHSRLPDRMSVMELMLASGRLVAGARLLPTLLRPRRTATEEREAVAQARNLLSRFGLEALADHPAGKLSGGQQKLLSLGMALMGDPRLLLLDEPTAGVNPTLRLQIARHLRELHADGLSVVTIEHDMRFIADVCDEVYVLDKGKVIACCPPSELSERQEVLEAYLGGSGRAALQRLSGAQEAKRRRALGDQPRTDAQGAGTRA